MTVEWRLRRVADDEIEEQLFDVQVFGAVNRFGRHAIAYIDDRDGEAFSTYTRGTPVEFEVSDDGGSTFDRRFAGFVIESKEQDNDGADEVRAEVYSYDHFLRRNNVTRSFNDDTIEEALEEIITDFTPLKWVPENVDVVNNITLTRGYKGEKVDNILAEFASKSAGEEFGANDDLEFFFRARETTSAPRAIDNTQWLDYDFPEKGAEAINELQLFYGEEGEKGSVIVTDGNDKLELQESIGTDGPVVFREEVTREDIDNESDARDKAEEILNERESIRTGTVTTYGLFDAEAGQVIPVTIDSAGIDEEFRIAEIEYHWRRDETVLTLVEKRGAQDDKLVRLTDTLKRVEQREADREAPATQFEGPLTSRALFEITATILTRVYGDDAFTPGFGGDEPGFGGAEPGFDIEEIRQANTDASRATRSLKNAVRDAWRGEDSPTLVEIAVGDGTTSPSIADTELENELDTVPATISLAGLRAGRWSGTLRLSQNETLTELGITNGDLFCRATTDAIDIPAQAPTDVSIRIEVLNDPESEGVITDDGGRVARDILTNNDADTPTQIAFGADNTTPETSDTGIIDEIVTVEIDEFRDRQAGEVDAIASFENEDTSSVTVREWAVLNANDEAVIRVTFADIILEPNDSLNGRQRYRWVNG